MKDYLNFTTIEDGEKALSDRIALRDAMGGALWWGVCNDECIEIRSKLNELHRQEQIDQTKDE